MEKANPSNQIEVYISKSAEFAQPICKKLREVIHKAEPQIVEEWKWGPNFQKNGMVCGFGAFKEHVNFFFFKGAYMKDSKKIFTEGSANRFIRGLKFKDVKEIDERTLTLYIKEAVKLNFAKIEKVDKTIELPADLKSILAKKKKLKLFFDELSFTNRKEYVRWIESAMKKETRDARLQKTVVMLNQGIKHP